MNIRNVLNEKLINLNLQANTKDEVLMELSHMLYNNGCISDIDAFLKDVYLRENEGETGLGSHIAIPHGKSNSVLKTSIVIGKTPHDVAWESLDDLPVRFIILFAVRMVDKSAVHIKLLAHVSELLADDDLLDQLLNIRTKKELFNLFEKIEED
ncbi:PTS sugar transporter subunit IIA [Celerinatantimonas diazotrophica]|uniref:PTS system fructose-specific IIA component n=1 Tax=Celerinatantimonas diazotrophica TaxID=412034 RepID=A0A4R1KBN0_9GAMM|nr:fructose PTS transporter subunit IIA [Celerinatantimonas diazotrophica]TCK61497.1 PTS system fructose-specific IIA component [Celerinatantimonas diazotrophica]CAG9296960.1 PTS system mannose-specific EIIBCA component [Celerinatantimonas diazotrophica]